MVERMAYSPKDMTKEFGIGMTTLYREINAGRLIARKFGTRTMFLAEDVNAWAKRWPVIPTRRRVGELVGE